MILRFKILVLFWPMLRPNKITDTTSKVLDITNILLVLAPGVLLSEVRVGTESGFWNRERGRTGIAGEELINKLPGKNCYPKSQ